MVLVAMKQHVDQGCKVLCQLRGCESCKESFKYIQSHVFGGITAGPRQNTRASESYQASRRNMEADAPDRYHADKPTATRAMAGRTACGVTSGILPETPGKNPKGEFGSD